MEFDEDGYSVLVNRTNNPLERFNRKLNERVPDIRLSKFSLNLSLKQITNKYVDTMRDIKYKKYKGKKHLAVPIPVILPDFDAFYY